MGQIPQSDPFFTLDYAHFRANYSRGYFQQCGFSGRIRPHQEKNLSGIQVESHILEDRTAPEAVAYIP
jgi:hypothetical protein